MSLGIVIGACIFLHIPVLIVFGLFLFSYHREPRRPLCGVLLALSGLLLGLMLLAEAALLHIAMPDAAITRFAYHVVVIVLPILGLLPTLLVLLTLGAGIRNLVKHGLHLRNTFAVFFSLAALVYMILWPLAKGFGTDSFSSLLYIYITVIFAYTIFLRTILTLTSEINLRHRKGPKGLSYVVVLGRPIKREPVAEIVRGRVDKGIEVYRMNEGSKLVLCGGYVADGTAACDLMAAYAKEQGVPEEDILIERNGRSTETMVLESYALLCGDYGERSPQPPKFAVVSTAYHVLRALILARRNRIACIGYGARTTLTISMNAFVREYLLYLKITKKTQLILLAVFTVVFWTAGLLLLHYQIVDPQSIA
ncbi:MAG: YdcF family protein [Clostridiales bacterium]|nr:YdcF family protein [Clostridiales bacterium]